LPWRKVSERARRACSVFPTPPQGGAVLVRPANAARSRLPLRGQAGRKASTPSPRLSTPAPTDGPFPKKPIPGGTEESALLPRLLPIPIVALASLE
jgi:hypothetical protein